MPFSTKSCLLDGSNESVTFGDVLAFEYDEAVSYSIWFKSTDDGELFSNCANAPGYRGIQIYLGGAGGGRINGQFLNNAAGPNGATFDTVSTAFADGKWHHMCLTKGTSPAASSFHVYVDGVDQPLNINMDTLSATILNGLDLHIGRCNAADPYWLAANIDDAAIYDKELSLAEVQAIYNSNTLVDLRTLSTKTNLVGYWLMGDGDNFAILRDRQVATAILAAGTIKDRSQNSNDGTPTNMEDADFRAVILATETMPDLSGSGNPGTPTNMEDGDFTTDTPGGVSGYSAALDGSNEYVTMGDVADLDFEYTEACSFSCWFKTSDTSSNNKTILSKQEGDTSWRGYNFRVKGTTGAINVHFINDALIAKQIWFETVSTGWHDGSWHHLAITKSTGSSLASGDFHLYIDGNDEALNHLTDDLSATIITSNEFQVGARDVVGSEDYFNGGIDDVAIYDEELSLSEVQAIYNSGAPTDCRLLSTASDLVGYWLMGELTAGGTSRFATVFDGSNEYVTMGNVAELDFDYDDPFSVSFWYKGIFDGGYAISKIQFTESRGWGVGIGPGLGQFPSFQLTHSAPAVDDQEFVVRPTASFDGNDGSWRHCVITYDGSDSSGVSIYINGVSQALQVDKDTLGANTTLNTGPVNIAGKEDGASLLGGRIDDAAIYDKELSEAEAQAIYNSGVPTDNTLLDTEINLVGYWLMGEDANDGTMTDMEAGDIVGDVPGSSFAYAGLPGDVVVYPIGQHYTFEPYVGNEGDGDGDAMAVTYYKMRAQDDGVPPPGYVTWVSMDNPDFAGAGFAGGSPAPVGSMVPGSATVT